MGYEAMRGLNVFPAERMHTDFPWPLWAIGWLAIFKAILWLAYEPVLPDPVLRVLGWKYILEALPLFVCGVALWRRQRWAAWGLALIAAADLALLVMLPQSFYAYLVDSEVFLFSILLSAVVLVCCGPVGDILILCGGRSLFRNTAARRRT
jgi:hypothetical protein